MIAWSQCGAEGTFLWLLEQTAICHWLKRNTSGRVKRITESLLWLPASADCRLWYTAALGHRSHCGIESCSWVVPVPIVSWKALVVLKPGQSRLRQSCINQALMLLNPPPGMQWDEKWAICRCLVVDWDIRDCPRCAAQGVNLSPLWILSVLLAWLFN